MATIGTFTKTANGYSGSIDTLMLHEKTVQFRPNDKSDDKAPDFRIFVGDVEGDQLPERLHLAQLGACGGLPAIDGAFGVDAPPLGVFVANEGFTDRVTLAADLDPPGSGFFSEDRGHLGVQIRCSEAS